MDGIVGTWFLQPWLSAAQEGWQIHYVILRADWETTAKRAAARRKLDRETNLQLAAAMWDQFRELGKWEAHVIDTTEQSGRETGAAVRREIECGSRRL